MWRVSPASTGFVFHSQTRPLTPTESSSPVSVRRDLVTDWPFSPRCSPPRITATQLRFDTARLFTAQKRTPTVLSPRLLRRTGADLQSALDERQPPMNGMELDLSTSYQTHARSRSQTRSSSKALAGRAGAPSANGHRQFLKSGDALRVLIEEETMAGSWQDRRSAPNGSWLFAASPVTFHASPCHQFLNDWAI